MVWCCLVGCFYLVFACDPLFFAIRLLLLWYFHALLFTLFLQSVCLLFACDPLAMHLLLVTVATRRPAGALALPGRIAMHPRIGITHTCCFSVFRRAYWRRFESRPPPSLFWCCRLYFMFDSIRILVVNTCLLQTGFCGTSCCVENDVVHSVNDTRPFRSEGSPTRRCCQPWSLRWEISRRMS